MKYFSTCKCGGAGRASSPKIGKENKLGILLPDATQWDLIEQVADSVYPVIRALEEVAASGEVIHNDDTSVRIVEIIRANKRDPTRKRRGDVYNDHLCKGRTL